LEIGHHKFKLHYNAGDAFDAEEVEEDLFARSLMEKAGLERPKGE
jgi:hypothetical protein